MWLAFDLTSGKATLTHQQLLDSLLTEQSSQCGVVLKFNLVKFLGYDLSSITCKTSRITPLTSEKGQSVIRLQQFEGEHTVTITQEQAQLLKDYIYALCKNRKSETYHTYESYQGSLSGAQIWSVYPELLCEPSDLSSYINEIVRNNTLAKFVRNLSETGSQLPDEVYVAHIQCSEATVSQFMLSIGLDKFNILPEMDSTPVDDLSDELSDVGLNSFTHSFAYTHHQRFHSTTPESPLPGSSNVTLVTPKGKPYRTRRPTSVGAPGAPRKSRLQGSSDSVDPLEDERWQVNVNRNLHFEQPTPDQ